MSQSDCWASAGPPSSSHQPGAEPLASAWSAVGSWPHTTVGVLHAVPVHLLALLPKLELPVCRAEVWEVPDSASFIHWPNFGGGERQLLCARASARAWQHRNGRNLVSSLRTCVVRDRLRTRQRLCGNYMGLWAHRRALSQPGEQWEWGRGFLEEGLPEGWMG